MHVLFLAPDTHVYNHGFLQGLRSVGARVSALGMQPTDKLSDGCKKLLDGYRQVSDMLSGQAMLAAAKELGQPPIDRIETIDEPLVEAAAALREQLQLPGLSLATARLCRDKVAMKELLRQHGVACAQSTSAASEAEIRAFAERVGYPLIVKPIAGFNSLGTWKLADARQLTETLPKLPLGNGRRLAVEEFVEGHEGFYDTIVDGTGIRHDFAAHYFPGCLEANRTRWISPQIAVTNRVEQEGYRELRAMGQKVIDALGLRQTGTHMEWFFGPKGLKFSEIGARPAGEKIWDMYRVANDFDVYREWALAVLGKPGEQSPSRRYAAGSVQIRPSQDGKYLRHDGLDPAWRRCRDLVYEYEIPAAGTPTKPLDKGWLCNTWFRLKHTDYDEVRSAMTFLGDNVKAIAN
ncbi:MAG: ATP-grasp domain-containing protein [Planctomycetes bacterium]|nr:ATP-grasp domain-containing protein [Planctomycetota bacterium]